MDNTVWNSNISLKMQNEISRCPTCAIGFFSDSEHHTHYRSELHRYNLKRKLVNLPPVTYQVFSTKLTTPIINQPASTYFCGECSKTFASKKTFEQHTRTKGHDPLFKRQPLNKQLPSILPYKKDAIKCIFCDHAATTLQSNLQHMNTKHGFFIPQSQFCCDKKGLIQYLQQKVQIGNLCIHCDTRGKDFMDGEAVRRHMIAKQHFWFKTEDGYEEYQAYYDFSEQFRREIAEQGPIIAGIEFQDIQVKEKIKEAEGSEDDWEDQEDEGQQMQQIKEEKIKCKTKTTTYRIMRPTETNTGELLLPNGKILGHRKFKQVYNQVCRLPAYYERFKMLANSPTEQGIIERNKVFSMITKTMRREITRGVRQHVKLGMRNNDLQRYFRIQNSM